MLISSALQEYFIEFVMLKQSAIIANDLNITRIPECRMTTLKHGISTAAASAITDFTVLRI